MKHFKDHICLLLLSYFLIVLIKLLLSTYFTQPSIVGDEVIYLWIAKNFPKAIHPGQQYPPLYPFLLSLFHFTDLQQGYVIAKAANAFISSLIVFPSFFLSCLFLDRNRSFVVAVLSILNPVSFLYSFTVMSENLFYPLFLTTIYFLIKSEKESKNYLFILAGIFISLTVLTRILGLVIIVSYITFSLTKWIIKKDGQLRNLIAVCSFSVILIPYFIWHGSKGSFNEVDIFGYSIYGSIQESLIGDYSLLNILWMSISHFDLLVFGCGVSLFLFALLSLRNIQKNSLYSDFSLLMWLIILSTILVSSIYISGEFRVISRYVGFLLPLLFIVGLKEIKRYRYKKSVSLTFAAIVTLVLTVLFTTTRQAETELLVGYLRFTWFFPVIPAIIYILILFFISSKCIVNLRLKQKKKILTFLSVIFILFVFVNANCIETSNRVRMSKEYYEKMNISKYLVETDEEIFFDINDYRNGYASEFWNIWYWRNDEIFLREESNSINNGYFISSKNLSYPIILQQNIENKNLLYLYKV